MSRPTIDPNGLLHIAIVVNDLDKAAAEWARLLGVEVPTFLYKGDCSHLEIEKDPRSHYRNDYDYGNGHGYEFREADFYCNGLKIELIEPEPEAGPFREYYDKHGTGIHHIAFRNGDKSDAVNDMLIADGYTYIVDTYHPNGDRWPVIDTEDVLGTNLSVKPGEEYIKG